MSSTNTEMCGRCNHEAHWNGLCVHQVGATLSHGIYCPCNMTGLFSFPA